MTSIIPATESDIPILTELVHASKLSLTINRLLYKEWPNTVVQLARTSEAIGSSLKDTAAESLKAVDNETGEILGYVVMTGQDAANAQRGKPDGSESHVVPDCYQPGVYAMVMQAIAEIAT